MVHGVSRLGGLGTGVPLYHFCYTIAPITSRILSLDSELERRSELVERKNQVEAIEALVAIFEYGPILSLT